jgi:membrane-bound lytic murein transglycosylase A
VGIAAAAVWFLGAAGSGGGPASAAQRGVDSVLNRKGFDRARLPPEHANLVPRAADPLDIPDTQLEPVSWSDLDGWAADDHAAAFTTFLASCKPFLATRRPLDPRPMYVGLWHVCRRAVAARRGGAQGARKFFEDNFRPVRIAKLGETTGLLTGYYEPIVEGSRFPNPQFHWPLYRRPRDLLVDGKKPPPRTIPNRAAIGRLNANNQVEPYYDRLAIENGALDGRHLEICWLRDPFEAMSIEIQGSARVRLEDGTLLRVGYDSHNGLGYTAIGRVLIERNLVPREEMSMDRIKQWMAANPDQAKEVRATNRSYVFFRITGLDSQDEPAGAEGVPLHPGRSIAVDRTHVFGTPFFIQADLPIASARPDTKFRRLMVAQDTGSAIVGPARADIYWGAGDNAGHIAGRIRQQGRFVILLPRELDMVAAGRSMPLPRPRPPMPDVNVAKKNGEPAGLATSAAGQGSKVPQPDPRPASAPQARASRVGAPGLNGVHRGASAKLYRRVWPANKRMAKPGHAYDR